jgi:putative transposase
VSEAAGFRGGRLSVAAGFSRPFVVAASFSRPFWQGACTGSGMRPRYPPHLPHFSYRGFHRYFLTWCCDGRALRFVTVEPINLVRSQIVRAAEPSGMAIVAWCYMPDHLHLLVEGTRPDADALRFINAAKQGSGFQFSRRFGDRLWQRYGHERVLRGDEDTRTVVRYLIENPVRAGLATDVRQYPHIGSQLWDREELIEWAYYGTSG